MTTMCKVAVIGISCAIMAVTPSCAKNRDASKTLQDTTEKTDKEKFNDLKLSNPDAGMVSIMDEVAKNKVTVVDVWASWCGPCMKAIGGLKSLYGEYKDKGLGVVGVSLDNDYRAWTETIRRMELEWINVSDLKGWRSRIVEMYGIDAIPYVFVIAQDGTIIRKGYIPEEELRQIVSESL